ncbi:MAG TPA: fumarylacetoacetate hydrolase family protein, partial [Dehalococcoidia bacterium]
MRLVTYTFRGTTRLGALADGDCVVDLNRAEALRLARAGSWRAQAAADAAVPPDMLALLRLGEEGLAAAREALQFAQEELARDRAEAAAAGLCFRTDEPGFRLEAPVPRPGTVLAIGLNYRDHAEETGAPLPEYPMVFTKVATCIIGPGQPVIRPRASTAVDWEGELCVVIGRPARGVTAAEAPAYVAGYMVGNDVTVRD